MARGAQAPEEGREADDQGPEDLGSGLASELPGCPVVLDDCRQPVQLGVAAAAVGFLLPRGSLHDRHVHRERTMATTGQLAMNQQPFGRKRLAPKKRENPKGRTNQP